MIEDLTLCLREGLTLDVAGEEITMRMCVVSVKGDWPFLIEVGHLDRHFRRAPKQESSQRTSFGICHLCCGGMPGISYTDCSDAPDWEKTMYSAAALCPWTSWSPWQDLPGLPNFRPWTFRPDVFHNFHLGHGKYFLSSSLVLLQAHMEGSSVENRFAELDREWKSYCKDQSESFLIYFFYCWFHEGSSPCV